MILTLSIHICVELLFLAMFEQCKQLGHEEAIILRAMKSRGPELNNIMDLIEVIYKIEENGPYEPEVSHSNMQNRSIWEISRICPQKNLSLTIRFSIRSLKNGIAIFFINAWSYVLKT